MELLSSYSSNDEDKLLNIKNLQYTAVQSTHARMLNVMVWGLNYSGACRILNVTETEIPKHDEKLIIGSYLEDWHICSLGIVPSGSKSRVTGARAPDRFHSSTLRGVWVVELSTNPREVSQEVWLAKILQYCQNRSVNILTRVCRELTRLSRSKHTLVKLLTIGQFRPGQFSTHPNQYID